MPYLPYNAWQQTHSPTSLDTPTCTPKAASSAAASTPCGSYCCRPAELLYSTMLPPKSARQALNEGSSAGGTASAKGSQSVLSLSNMHTLKPAAFTAGQSTHDMSGTEMWGSAKLWFPCRAAEQAAQGEVN